MNGPSHGSLAARLDTFFSAAGRRLNPERAMEAVAGLLIERLGAHTALIAQWDKIAGRYTCQNVYGSEVIVLSGPEGRGSGGHGPDPCEFLPDGDFANPEAGFRVFPFAEAAARLALFPGLAAARETTDFIAFLPIAWNDTPVALLVLLSKAAPRAELAPAELARLSFYCASVLINSRLRNESMQKSAKLATLSEISKNAGSLLAPTDVMNSLTDAAKKLVPFETCLLFLAEGRPGDGGKAGERGPGKLSARRIVGDAGAVKDILDNPEASEAGRVIETRDPLLFHHGKLKSCICVPVTFENRVLGALFLGSEKQYAYDMSDLISVSILASHFASIDNGITALLTMRNYSKSFLDSMNAGLVAFDNDGIVTHMNALAAKLLGSPAEPEGLPFRDVAPGRPEITELIGDALSRGLVVENREIAGAGADRHPDGAQILEVTTYAFTDGEGIRLGVAMLLRDVTDERRMAERMQRVERLRVLGEMTASIAHEVRNPLTGIKMIAQLLEDEVKGFNPKLLEYTQLQIKEVERLDRIISAMLSFARPSRPQLATNELNGLLDGILFLLEDELRKKELAVVRRYAPRADARCDEAQMKQVFWNLFQNALYASTPGGAIEVETQHAEGRTTVAVIDHGLGIKAADKPRIFDPFYSTKEKGTGLGLSIAHTILQEHGGTIEFDSEEGRGTTVRVTLPDAP